MALLAPSILSADLLQLKDQIKIVEENGADWIHVDVMDGQFVPNITFGPAIVEASRRVSDLPLDVHLMIVHPENYIEQFASAGANLITVHQEACPHLDRIVNQIKEAKCKAGVAINPATPVAALEPVLPDIDLLLIMSVNPGFGGQKFIPYTLRKMRRAVQLRDHSEGSFLIEVDGGVNPETVARIIRSGADVLVAGQAIFGQTDLAAACRKMKELSIPMAEEV